MNENPWLELLSQWLISHPGWAGLLIFFVAFTESIVVVGILIPGIMILFALGTLIGLGLVDFYLAWATATLGAILGDSLSYWLGYRYRGTLMNRWPFNRWPELLQQGRDLFRRRGILSVVIGRFVGPLRPIIPVVAGMLAMPPRHFYPTAIAAGIAWSPAFLLPGVVLGASLDVASAYTLRLGVLLGIVVLGAWLVAITVRGVYRTLTRRTPWLLKRSVSTLRRHPRLAHYIGPLVIPARGDILSIAMLGLVLVVSLTVVSGALLYAVIPGTPDLDALWRLGATQLRNHVADVPLLLSLMIGDWRVLSLAAISCLCWLLWRRRRLAAGHWFAAIAGAPLLALITQALLQLLPAWPESLAPWGRFPDLASTYATAVLGFFPTLLARDIRAYQRKWFYLLAALLMMLALFARLYFQLATLSGVVSAVLLSTIWCTIVGIGFRVRASAWHPAPPLILSYALSFVLGLILVLVLRGPSHLHGLRPQPRIEHSNHAIWLSKGWDQLPHYRGWFHLGGNERFNIQWHGDLNAIRHSLENSGWQWQEEPPTAAQIIHILHPRPQHESLPLFRQDYQGRAASALAWRTLDALPLAAEATPQSGQRIAVLRFWDSGLRLPSGAAGEDQPVWLGEAVEETVQVHGWWFTTWTAVHTRDDEALKRVIRDSIQWQRQQRSKALPGRRISTEPGADPAHPSSVEKTVPVWLLWQEP